MSERQLEVLVTGRREGKTTEAIAWLNAGEKRPGYPGWSRVLVVPTFALCERLQREFWGRMEDPAHRIYSLNEWSRAHGVRWDTEVRIDDFDMLLPYLPGRLTGITLSGQVWDVGLGRAPYSEPIGLRS